MVDRTDTVLLPAERAALAEFARLYNRGFTVAEIRQWRCRMTAGTDPATEDGAAPSPRLPSHRIGGLVGTAVRRLADLTGMH